MSSMTYTGSSCLELAIEGERLCRTGEWRKGISCFQTALSNGTDDLRCLSAIYCQLGNAYYCHENYTSALEFHRLDVALAKMTSDVAGEAQACNNLGNTLKMLGRFDEAIMCFNRQLDLAKQMGNQSIEVRALYNLGNVYHAKGKQLARNSNFGFGQSDPGELPAEAVEAQRTALEFYSQNLALVHQMGDRPAEGRVYGNLGNTHYLLGNFHEAIRCHQERLNFANEFGDLAAQRRAYSNLGNAYIFLADFNSAATNYRNALRIARQLNEICLEAQACYSLGNTYTLLRDPAKAIVYHLRHLLIARRLGDRVGEGRAHWSLSNAFAALGRFDWALRCARRHRMIARELHDDTGLMAAQLMIREVQSFMSKHDRDQRDSIATNGWSTESEVSGTRNAIPNGAPPVPCRSTSLTTLATETESSSKGENNECANLEEDNDLDLDADLERELASTAADVLDTVEVVTLGENGKTTAIRLGCLDIPDTVTADPQVTKRDHMASFYSNTPAFRPHPMQPTSRTNSNDIEEQLESIGTANPSNPPSQAYHLPNGSDASIQAAATTEEEQAEDPQECFYSLLLTSQSRRMDEQRCQLRAAPVSLSYNRRSEPAEAAEQSGSTASMHAEAVPDEALFDLIEGVQGDRMNDQRASLPAFPGLRAGRSLQLFDGGSLGNVHGAMLTSTGSGASDGLPEPSSTRSFRTHGLRENSTGNESTNNHGTIRELDDEFLDMILHLQTSTRINDQRSNLPDPLYRDSATQRYSLTIGVTTTGECCSVPDRPASGSFSRPTAATVPDEDFFALIQRVQSTRLDEQRCNPPAPVPRPDVPPNEPEPSPPLSRSDSKSSSGSRRRGTSWRRLAPNQNR